MQANVSINVREIFEWALPEVRWAQKTEHRGVGKQREHALSALSVSIELSVLH